MGFSADFVGSGVDESILKGKEHDPKKLSMLLSYEKALAVSEKFPENLVIGSDQVMALDGEAFNKAENLAEAKNQLKALSGKTHELFSAAAIARKGQVIFEALETCALTMWSFEDDFIHNYLDCISVEDVKAAGIYKCETYGALLFEEIRGNLYAVMGFPLLPILSFLRNEGVSPFEKS